MVEDMAVVLEVDMEEVMVIIIMVVLMVDDQVDLIILIKDQVLVVIINLEDLEVLEDFQVTQMVATDIKMVVMVLLIILIKDHITIHIQKNYNEQIKIK